MFDQESTFAKRGEVREIVAAVTCGKNSNIDCSIDPASDQQFLQLVERGEPNQKIDTVPLPQQSIGVSECSEIRLDEKMKRTAKRALSQEIDGCGKRIYPERKLSVESQRLKLPSSGESTAGGIFFTGNGQRTITVMDRSAMDIEGNGRDRSSSHLHPQRQPECDTAFDLHNMDNKNDTNDGFPKVKATTIEREVKSLKANSCISCYQENNNLSSSNTQVGTNEVLFTNNLPSNEDDTPELTMSNEKNSQSNEEGWETNGESSPRRLKSQSPRTELHDITLHDCNATLNNPRQSDIPSSSLSDTYQCLCLNGVRGEAESDNESTKDVLLATRNLRDHNSPSVNQLKIALFQEATKVHGCRSEAVRIFTNYWNTLGTYLSQGLRAAVKRAWPDLMSRISIESVLTGFLKTKRMKLIHNKLILSLMAEAMNKHVSSHFSAHMPHEWLPKSNQSICTKVSEVNNSVYDRSTAMPHWNACFGRTSGAWMARGEDITFSKIDRSQCIDPKLVGSFPSGALTEECTVPSCRLPGALYIDPLVRKLTRRFGLKASDNAVWMIVVAIREYVLSLLHRIIANDKHFASAHTAQLPTYFPVNLACRQNMLSESNSFDEGGLLQNEHFEEGEQKRKRRRIINSTSLSNILAEKLSASTRLTSMYSDVASGDRRGLSSLPGLEEIKFLINSSIQETAIERYKSAARFENKSSTNTTIYSDHTTNTIPTKALLETPSSLVPRPDTAQSISNSAIFTNRPQHAALTFNYPAMPFRRSNNSYDKPLAQKISQAQLSQQTLHPMVGPIQDLPSTSQEPRPRVIINSTEITTMNIQVASAGSKNFALLSRSDNEASKNAVSVMEEKDDRENVTPPPVSENNPDTLKSRGYGVKNLAAMKARNSST